MLKKICLFSLLFSTVCSAAPLTTYQEAVDALNNGKNIKFVVDWEHCKFNIPNFKPEFSASIAPTHVNTFHTANDRHIRFWETIYIQTLKTMPQIGPAHHAHIYTFNEKQELNVIVYFLDPVTYKEKVPAIEASCQLGNGFRVFSY